MRIGKLIFKAIMISGIVIGAMYLYNYFPNNFVKNFDNEFNQYLKTKNEKEYYKLLYTLNTLQVNYEVEANSIKTKYFNYSLDNEKVSIDEETPAYIMCKTLENQKTINDYYTFSDKDGKHIVSDSSSGSNLTFDGKNYLYTLGWIKALLVILLGVGSAISILLIIYFI